MGGARAHHRCSRIAQTLARCSAPHKLKESSRAALWRIWHLLRSAAALAKMRRAAQAWRANA